MKENITITRRQLTKAAAEASAFLPTGLKKAAENDDDPATKDIMPMLLMNAILSGDLFNTRLCEATFGDDDSMDTEKELSCEDFKTHCTAAAIELGKKDPSDMLLCGMLTNHILNHLFGETPDVAETEKEDADHAEDET